MMSPSDRLADVFDRALSAGLESLTNEERDLYLIQDFIIETEMNGLSGYFYNRLPDLRQISSAIAAMRQYGLPDLAAFLTDAFQLFDGYTQAGTATKWSDVLKQCDPENQLDAIGKRINALDNYGVGTSRIQ